ncbi:TPA: hypothetical protein O4I50_001250 [Vibrio parahaemolyticus]|nr:hypothetical protein [Vibrio parahaemolyticus]
MIRYNLLILFSLVTVLVISNVVLEKESAIQESKYQARREQSDAEYQAALEKSRIEFDKYYRKYF